MARMDVILAKTRYVYPSYTDLNRLFDLSGLETCHIDGIDHNRDAVYVVGCVNGEYRPHRANAKNPKAFLVFWSLERPGPERFVGYCAGMRKLLNEWNFDEIWSADPYVVDKIADSRIRYVPIGGHPDLESVVREEPKYDFAHMSCQSGRRNNIYKALEKAGKTMAPNAYGEARTTLLGQSRYMLNVHQDDWPILEPLRFVLAACCKLPIISEHVEHAGIYSRHGANHYYIDVHYAELAETALGVKPVDMAAMAERTYDMVTTEFGFSRVVLSAVDAIAQARELNAGVIR